MTKEFLLLGFFMGQTKSFLADFLQKASSLGLQSGG
jgi:hypothetical protein